MKIPIAYSLHLAHTIVANCVANKPKLTFIFIANNHFSDGMISGTIQNDEEKKS